MSGDGPEHDAWLREALRHAPDASASPPPSLSDAILAEARAAARAGAPQRTASSASLLDRALAFWSWLARPPVAAGFASVMAATLVGMLWWDRPMDETMPPPTSPAVTAPRSAQERGDVAGQRQSPSADADSAAVAPPADRVTEAARPPASALRETAPTPAKTAAPRLAAETGAVDAERKQQVARAAADERARSQPEAKLAAKSEVAAAAAKDDKVAQAPPPATAMAPATGAATPPAPGVLRPAAEAPSPFPARSPTEVAATPRPAAPAAAPLPPPTTTPSPQPPEAAQGRAEPFALEKKAESGEKEGAAAKARLADRLSERQAPAAGGALGGGTLDSSETRSTGRVAAQNAAGPAARQPAAPVVASPRPMAPLLAALASEETLWSRRLASGESAAVDAGLRAWLAQVQSAAARWESAGERSARRDGPAAPSTAILRLERDGRAGAVVQIEDGGVLFDPLSGSVWFAPLPPEVVARLRATLPAPR